MPRLRETFELYLHAGGDAPRFEALTCASAEEALEIARLLLAERRLDSVEVRQFGVLLFTLGGPRTDIGARPA